MSRSLFLNGLRLENIFLRNKSSLNSNGILVTVGNIAVSTLFGIKKRARKRVSERRLFDAKENLHFFMIPYTIKQRRPLIAMRAHWVLLPTRKIFWLWSLRRTTLIRRLRALQSLCRCKQSPNRGDLEMLFTLMFSMICQ